MFITFEGIDASGKTTQLRRLAEELQRQDKTVVVTRQPGGTAIGQKIREILLDPANTALVPEAEVLLYVADRVQHIQETILPALKAGKIVLCDRYHDATIAYQGGGRQLDLSWLAEIEQKLIPLPDMTLWFDISIEVSQQRLNRRNQEENVENCRLESENALFFERTRQAYLDLCQRNSGRMKLIRAEGELEAISAEVFEIVWSALGD